MNRSICSLLLALGACNDAVPEGDDTDLPLGFQVLRDCAPDVGVICPYAGTGDAGFNGDDLDLLDSWFSFPMSVHFSPYGRPIIADWNNHRLREVTDDHTLRTIMGTAFLGDGDFEQRDMVDGAPGTIVNLNHPTQQRYMTSGLLVSASWHTHKLRTWDPLTGMTRVLVGTALGFNPPDDVPGAAVSAVGTQLNQPRWVEVDRNGDLFILDMRNQRIRKLAMNAWEITTVAGSGRFGIAGHTDADPSLDCSSEDAWQTCFAFPFNDNPEPGGAMQLNEDETLMYVADSLAHVIRVVDLVNHRVTVLAGAPGVADFADGAAVDARFNFPSSLALDHAANVLFIADSDNHRVRALDLSTLQVSTFAGTGDPTCTSDVPTASVTCEDQPLSGDGGPAVEAKLYRPFGVDLDLDGNLVISDTYNHRLRVVYR